MTTVFHMSKSSQGYLQIRKSFLSQKAVQYMTWTVFDELKMERKIRNLGESNIRGIFLLDE